MASTCVPSVHEQSSGFALCDVAPENGIHLGRVLLRLSNIWVLPIKVAWCKFKQGESDIPKLCLVK
jgi:hypothetical protein